MNFSIPAAGMQAASTAFDAAASGISRAFTNGANNSSSPALNPEDSVDLSTSVVNLLSANLDFSANVKSVAVEDEMNRSTFSILG